MTNERIKEILLDVIECSIDFSVIQTGKESKRVNGFYKPDTHEIFLHNGNFKTENALLCRRTAQPRRIPRNFSSQFEF